MATRKAVTANEGFRILAATEQVEVAKRTRETSENTKQASNLLASLVTALPKGRQAVVPTSSFPNVRQAETPKKRAQAVRSFVKRWATDNGNPFSSVALSSDYASLVITRSK